MNDITQPSFYFHDYETFGTHPALDRPAQFAGVRTDSELNIIEEPLVIYCKQTPDYLPNPEAVLITGITPQETQQKGVCEAVFSESIHRAFSQPNTCILGYNNIRFDDEVSRNIFYRNFFDPYAYSWKNSSSRWDLLDIVRTCYALRPEGINWPINDNGFASFRLEHLSHANHISHQNAHDAMSDVYATIEMAKLIKQKQPKLFDYFFHLRNKNQVAKLIDIVNMTPLVHISGMLGAHRGNTALMAPIAWHPNQPNAVIMCDLAGDIDTLCSLDAEQITQRLYTKTEDLTDDESRIALKLIHTNKCPVIAPAKTLSVDNAKRLSLDLDVCHANWLKLKAAQHLITQKVQLIFGQSPSYPIDNDVDSQIYNGFFDNYDKSLCELIRDTDPARLDTLKLVPHDARLKALFFRYKARNYPQTLTESEKVQWRDHCQDKLNEEAVRQYLINLEALVQQYSQQPKQIELLKDLYHYCQYLVS
ncbi:exodeoxyribonuclease I subunit C [Orbus hercynius]|uniref:Exodeoxyribonuclease I n=1 Tax=Orbus hercynius TaxID=593135 RepID=A0A495RIP7_9GAMM|nr:exodeoxyribonuclease I [Orbus hercynius]RKS87281.1 exodeoxyribonuclease I subunit C [Orbus hercynius]